MIKKYYKEINELKKKNNTYDQKIQELEKEKQKIKEDLDEYKNELNKIYYIHKEEKQSILNGLNNKIKAFKELGDRYEETLNELLINLDNKNVSIAEYKKKDLLNDKHSQEIQEIKKIEGSNIENKDKELKNLIN